MAPAITMPAGILDDDLIVSSQPENTLDERRFVWHQKLLQEGPSATNSKGKPITQNITGRKSAIGKHQVNYSATKYIKPWRTGTKSQQLPVARGQSKNSGKGGK